MEWATVGGGVISGVIVALAGFVLLYLANATRLMKRVDALTERVFLLQDDITKCESERGNLVSEVQNGLRRIIALENRTRTLNPEPRAGVVVADLKGVIRVFSPSLVALFKWLPEELRGRPITTLMPPDVARVQQAVFNRFVADPTTVPDPHKIILTEGIDKYGARFPVAVTLDGWQVGKEGLITASIRERDMVEDKGATNA